MYKDFPAKYYGLLANAHDFVLLETSRYDADNHHTFLFLNPIRILQIESVTEVGSLLRKMQHYTQLGYYVAGYFGYECSAYFEHIRPWENSTQHQPLAWFGVYHQPLIFHHLTGEIENLANSDTRNTATTPSANTYTVRDMQFDYTLPQYREKIARVKQYIEAGDTYQINFTGRYSFSFEGSPLAFYNALKKKQQVSYSAYIRAAGQDILCFSPELFFRIAEDRIITKPMKGTSPRGHTKAEDQQRIEWLQADEKNAAENVMIVDLLRNDLGRLCRIGSIQVPDLFSVEQFATLLQMTSTVEGILASELDYTALFRSLFPSGSVTGAPKIRSMQLIRELETSPRGIYTGAIGYLAPASTPKNSSELAAMPWKAIFNVAIRTIVLQEGRGTMGVGSGIVYDSITEEEYAECAVKAEFLTAPSVEFSILETILWDDGYRQLDKHLSRMAESAAYFAYPYDHEQVLTALMQESAACIAGCSYKVRLTMESTGAITCERILLDHEQLQQQATIVISQARTHTSDTFLYHKTTNRAFYDEAYQRAVREGHRDVIFLNERGEVTEGAISTIFVEKNQQLLTPPLRCGLLKGIYRQCILEERANAHEEVLNLKDIEEADKLFICNVIRGWQQVTLASDQP